jgi:uridylate kinase
VLDNIGMLATTQNALYLAEILNKKNYEAEIFTALQADKVAKFYTPAQALTSLKEGKICFLSGGTGNPYFTTDTAAVLRAIELGFDIVLKGTKVDGLYTDDPKKNPKAEFIHSATFAECLDKKLGVMDMTAFSLAQDSKMPIKIFNIMVPGNIKEAARRSDVGTYIHA